MTLLMYLLASLNIIIGDLRWTYVSQVDITKSWRELTDTATIIMPRQMGAKRFDQMITTGAPVTIALGYNGALHVEFQGYVSRVYPGYPVRVECEDEMYQLKRQKFNKSWASANVQEVISHIAGSYEREVVSAELGPFQIHDANGVQVLQAIKSEYGLVSYFKNQKLWVGYKYPTEYSEHKYHHQHNIIDASTLEYVRAEDVEIKVKGISMQPDGSKLTYETGDEGGSQRTLHFYALDEATLKARADEELANIKVDGYDGSFTGFGYPYTEHGDVADVDDAWFQERNGKYLVDGVRVRFSLNGYRRVVELGPRAES